MRLYTKSHALKSLVKAAVPLCRMDTLNNISAAINSVFSTLETHSAKCILGSRENKKVIQNQVK